MLLWSTRRAPRPARSRHPHVSVEEVSVNTPGPGNDRSLTADEARTWELIEKNLRLRERRRHRVVGFVVRSARRPLVLIGLVVVGLGAALAGAAFLPREAALVVALSVAVVGLGLVICGALGGPRPGRPAPASPSGRAGRTRRGRGRRRPADAEGADDPDGPDGPDAAVG
jgi:hypothetical protein